MARRRRRDTQRRSRGPRSQGQGGPWVLSRMLAPCAAAGPGFRVWRTGHRWLPREVGAGLTPAAAASWVSSRPGAEPALGARAGLAQRNRERSWKVVCDTEGRSQATRMTLCPRGGGHKTNRRQESVTFGESRGHYAENLF